MSEHLYVSTQITSHTAVGGDDNPNCFSLAGLDGADRDVRIVNMTMGPFERVARRFLHDGRVRIRPLMEYIGLIDDPRVPISEMHNDCWCTVCCPFSLLPMDQQRAFLRHMEPGWDERGKLFSWSGRTNAPPHTDEQIDAWLLRLSASPND